MDKMTGTEGSAGLGVRQASNGASLRQAAQQGELVNSEINGSETPVLASVLAVAAEAKEEKVKSLNALQSVSQAIDDAVEVLNQALSLKNTAAVIRRDEQLNRYLVTIKDKESGEIVREIPDEALLKFARNLQELRGILFDETT